MCVHGGLAPLFAAKDQVYPQVEARRHILTLQRLPQLVDEVFWAWTTKHNTVTYIRKWWRAACHQEEKGTKQSNIYTRYNILIQLCLFYHRASTRLHWYHTTCIVATRCIATRFEKITNSAARFSLYNQHHLHDSSHMECHGTWTHSWLVQSLHISWIVPKSGHK